MNINMAMAAGKARLAEFTCRRSDGLFVAIERCLDNRMGTCFVVDETDRLVGRVTLDGIRAAILDGHGSLEACLEHPEAPTGAAAAAVVPIIADERIVDVCVDRRNAFVQVAQPDLTHAEFRAVLDAFLSTWVSSKGSYIETFEREFAAFIGMKYGIATSNGTVALHLALLALGIGPGDEVIVPDLTFAATINAVLYCGATPVIVDVDPLTWTMTLKDVAAAYTSRTRAIIPVHLYGRPAEIEPIADFARRRGIYVVEDCAEAHGAQYAGRKVGSFSDVSCLSFYGNKIVTTGEGGICLTNSSSLAATLQELRSHGMVPNRGYWHERIGYNYRMTNLQAAVGVAQLRRIDRMLERNERLERLYREHLGSIPELKFPADLPRHCQPVVWLVCAQVPAEARAELIEAAKADGLEIRPFFHRLSEMPPYRKFAAVCPHSALLAQTGINLPTSAAVDAVAIQKIERVLRAVLVGTSPSEMADAAATARPVVGRGVAT